MPTRWDKPSPLGQGEAVERLSFVAAPLLASGSLALLGVIAQSEERFRWPGFSLLILTVAAILLIFSVQAGSQARSTFYSPADIADWWPEDLQADDWDWVKEEHARDFENWNRWSNRSRLAFNMGVVALLVAVSATLAPQGNEFLTQSSLRWAASAVAAIAAIVEAGLSLARYVFARRTRHRLLRWRGTRDREA
jgi:hypothetical protein